MKQNENYHIAENTLIASLLDSLVSITFAQTKEERQNYKSALELKLIMLIPKSLATPKDKLLCSLIAYTASYTGLEEIEIKALQMLKNIDFDIVEASKIISTLPKDEATLKQLSKELLIPTMIGLDVDLELEFKELDGMRNHLGI